MKYKIVLGGFNLWSTPKNGGSKSKIGSVLFHIRHKVNRGKEINIVRCYLTGRLNSLYNFQENQILSGKIKISYST